MAVSSPDTSARSLPLRDGVGLGVDELDDGGDELQPPDPYDPCELKSSWK